MDPNQILTDVLAAATAGTNSGCLSVRYHRKRAELSYHDGPDPQTVANALAAYVDSGMLRSVTVTRHIPWTCGELHDSEAAAWFAHEGAHLVTETGEPCELGCLHGPRMVPFDELLALLDADTMFVSAKCRPRGNDGHTQVAVLGTPTEPD